MLFAFAQGWVFHVAPHKLGALSVRVGVAVSEFEASGESALANGGSNDANPVFYFALRLRPLGEISGFEVATEKDAACYRGIDWSRRRA